MLGTIGSLYVVKTWDRDATARARVRAATPTAAAGPTTNAGAVKLWNDDDIR